MAIHAYDFRGTTPAAGGFAPKPKRGVYNCAIVEVTDGEKGITLRLRPLPGSRDLDGNPVVPGSEIRRFVGHPASADSWQAAMMLKLFTQAAGIPAAQIAASPQLQLDPVQVLTNRTFWADFTPDVKSRTDEETGKTYKDDDCFLLNEQEAREALARITGQPATGQAPQQVQQVQQVQPQQFVQQQVQPQQYVQPQQVQPQGGFQGQPQYAPQQVQQPQGGFPVTAVLPQGGIGGAMTAMGGGYTVPPQG